MAGRDPLAGASADLAAAGTTFQQNLTRSTAAATQQAAQARQKQMDAQRKAREAAFQQQQEQSQSWYGTLLDNFWMDDFQSGPFGTGNVVADAWKQGVGDKVNAATTGITRGYDAWSQAASYGVGLLPGGIELTWDQARKVSLGQAGLLDAAARQQSGNGASKALGNMVMPFQMFSAGAIDVFDKGNPINNMGAYDAERDKGEAFSGIGMWATGVPDTIFTFFLDPLVLAGKAVKVARFGSDAMNWAGLTNRQLTTKNNAALWSADVDNAFVHLDDPTATATVANEHASFLARATYEELDSWHILDKNPFKDVIAAVGANIKDERDALVFLGALGGDPRYVARLQAEQHAAFDALTRAKNVSAHEVAMLNYLSTGGRQIPAVLDDVAEANVRADQLIADLERRNTALKAALGITDAADGTPLLQNVGSRSVRYERFRNAWNAGEGNRTPNRVNGKNTRMSVWEGRANESSFLDADTFLREGRIGADDYARIKRAEEMEPGSRVAGYERVFKASSHMRPVRLWSWATGEKASGFIDVKGIGVGTQVKELRAALTDSKTVAKDQVFMASMIQIWNDALVSNSPEARMQAVKKIEDSVSTYLANKYGVDADTMRQLYAALDQRRSQVVDQFNSSAQRTGRAYGVNPEDGSLIRLDPVFSSQLETKMPMLDFNILERTAKIAGRAEYRGLKMAENRILAENLLDEVASLWKASVLLRLGYTQRNVVEGWLRTAAVLGTIPALAYSPKMLKNFIWTNRQWSGRGRMASRFELEQKVVGANLATTRQTRQMLQQELADAAARANPFAPATMATDLEVQGALAYQRGVNRVDRVLAGENARMGLGEARAAQITRLQDDVARLEVEAPGSKELQAAQRELRKAQKPVSKAATQRERKRILDEEVAPNLPAGDPVTAAVLRLRAQSARSQSPNFPSRDGGKVKIAGVEVEAVRVYAPSKGTKAILKDADLDAETFYEITDAELFARLIGNAKTKLKHGSSVTAYEPAQYAGMRLFISKDGKVGFALRDGDDIVSAFNASNRKGSAHSIMQVGIEQGGRRADAFDTVLPGLYSKHGMEPVSRVRFNGKHAPDGWDYDTYGKYNAGRPDVVGFAYNPRYTDGYTPRQGQMFDEYDDMLDSAQAGVPNAELDAIRASLDDVIRQENMLSRQYALTLQARKRYGKRKLGDDAAFSGANGNLYRNLASNQETNERALYSAWGRQAEREMSEKNWVLVEPGQPQYFDELARGVEQMQNDALAMQAMSGASVTDMNAWLRETDEGRAYIQTMRLTTSQERAAQARLVHDMVHEYLPSKAARDAATIRGVVPQGDELRALLANEPLPLKPVHGRAVQETLHGPRTANEMIHKPINWLFEKLGTIPETVLVRQPFYNTVWQRRVNALTRIQTERNGGLALSDAQIKAIETNAHTFALKAVNDTLYTIQRYSNPADAFRFIAPFFPAWENSMKVWLGIVIRDPSVAVRASMLWQIPNEMGMVVDEKGNKIESDPFAFGTGSINRFIQFPKGLKDAFAKASELGGDLPVVGGAFRAMGSDGFRIPQGSLNVVSPGSTPWLPGFGPVVVAPIGLYLSNKPDEQAFLRKVMGDALYQQIAPFGVASGDVMDTVAPPALRKQWQAWQGESSREYLQAVDAMMRTAMIDWYEAGSRPEDRPNPDDIRQKANDFYLFSTLASLTLPFALSRTSKYQVEIDAWNNMKATPGMTYAEKVDTFLRLHGDSFIPIVTSSSGSRSKDLDPTLETWQVLDENRPLVEALSGLGPEALGLLGSTAPLGQFDQGTYDYWLQADIPGQPGVKFKATLSPGEMQERIELSGAWREYNQLKAERDAALAARGGMSMEANANADIKAQWMYATDVYMRQKYGASWTVAYNDYQSKQGTYLEGIQTVLNSDSFSRADSPMWGTVREYMDVRAEAMQAILDGGDSATVRDQFAAWAGELRFTSLEFADFFDNYLANDELTIGVN